ncbi:MAG: PQQ-binding-like beta-propeller repeat protein [Haliea sp.]|uniref:PQQ-binding-like beta-propeller repeat protein n=1 Tax=Haliea sp. TaxID=1932666 RepID=UPI0032EC3856
MTRDNPWTQAQWNSIHGDSRNSDAVPYPTAAHYALKWHRLQDAAVLFGPTVDLDGNLYLCSGRGTNFSHLHALDADGDLRWESEPWTNTGHIGPRACPFAPLVDASGAIFLADDQAFFCVEGDGSPRWRTDLHALGIREGFASAVFSASGHVGGVSLDGFAVLLDRATGAPVVPPLALPRGTPPPAASLPPGLWQGMMDKETAALLFPGFFGTHFPVTNSPAVDLDSGLLYITGAGDSAMQTRLYALREEANQLKIVFTRQFDGRCSVTPSLSPSGHQVYTGNHRGELLAFAADSGTPLWRYAPAGPAASPSVGSDGTIYTGSNTVPGAASQLSAIDPETGEARWCRDYDALASELLPERAPLKPFFTDPRPHAVVNSVQTLGRDHLLVVLALGYTFTPPGAAPLTQPHQVVLASIDPGDGALTGYTRLPDTSEAGVVMARDGSVYTCHAALTSSIFYRGINPLLPPSHRTALEPKGGVTALRPAVVKNPRSGRVA